MYNQIIGLKLERAKQMLDAAHCPYSVEFVGAPKGEWIVVRTDCAYHLVCMGVDLAPKTEAEND